MYIHTHTRPVTLWHEADPQCIAALSRTPSGARPCARATEGGCQCACQTVPFVQVLPAVHTARGRAAGAAAGLPLSGPGPSGSGHGAAGNAALCTAPGPAATGSLPVGHSPAFPLELSRTSSTRISPLVRSSLGLTERQHRRARTSAGTCTRRGARCLAVKMAQADTIFS
jgi:hypothetical protein